LGLKDLVELVGLEEIEGIDQTIGIVERDGIEGIDMIGMDIVGSEGIGVLSRIDYRRFFRLGLGTGSLLPSGILLSTSSRRRSGDLIGKPRS
jgi:hypothetical protein